MVSVSARYWSVYSCLVLTICGPLVVRDRSIPLPEGIATVRQDPARREVEPVGEPHAARPIQMSIPEVFMNPSASVHNLEDVGDSCFERQELVQCFVSVNGEDKPITTAPP